MAIADVVEYAHLSDADLAALGVALEAVAATSRIRAAKRTGHTSGAPIAFQRFLDVAARLVIAGSSSKIGWALGTTALAVAKSIENTCGRLRPPDNASTVDGLLATSAHG